MGNVGQLGQQISFLPRTAIPAAGTYTFPLKLNPVLTVGGGDIGAATPANQRLQKIEGIRALPLEATFEYGAAGTSAKFWLQASFDGVNWHDVVNFAFLLASSRKVATVLPVAAVPAVATDGTLADDTLGGPVGPFWRVKYTIVGAYTGSFITIKGTPEA